MEFECPECGRIFATAGTCPDDFLELAPLADEEEEPPKPFYPQDEYKAFDEDEDEPKFDDEQESERRYEEV